MSARSGNLAISAVVVVASVALAGALASARKAPPREEQENPGPLVEATAVTVTDHQVVVKGRGTVRSKVTAQLVPQVSGQVVAVHPGLAAGGYFEAGDTLLEIDPADYRLAVQRAEAAVAQARVKLQLEEGEGEVARRQWLRMHPDEVPPSPLVLREPQLEQAGAELAAAEADLATAVLKLERTRVSLPWPGRVLSRSVDLGQFVVAGQAVATAYGTEAVEVPVPLEDSELAWFAVPGPGEAPSSGAAAAVSADFAGSRHRWQGRVVRCEGEVDPATRMVHVVVEVQRPFAASGHRPPMVPGMFVEVEIAGSTLRDVVQVPRSALRSGNILWVVAGGRLELRPVTVAHHEGDTSFISSGLEGDELVVVSQLDVVTDGMTVRVVGNGDTAEAEGAS